MADTICRDRRRRSLRRAIYGTCAGAEGALVGAAGARRSNSVIVGWRAWMNTDVSWRAHAPMNPRKPAGQSSSRPARAADVNARRRRPSTPSIAACRKSQIDIRPGWAGRVTPAGSAARFVQTRDGALSDPEAISRPDTDKSSPRWTPVARPPDSWRESPESSDARGGLRDGAVVAICRRAGGWWELFHSQAADRWDPSGTACCRSSAPRLLPGCSLSPVKWSLTWYFRGRAESLQSPVPGFDSRRRLLPGQGVYRPAFPGRSMFWCCGHERPEHDSSDRYRVPRRRLNCHARITPEVGPMVRSGGTISRLMPPRSVGDGRPHRLWDDQTSAAGSHARPAAESVVTGSANVTTADTTVPNWSGRRSCSRCLLLHADHRACPISP